LFDVAADIADFGEFGCLDLEEGRLGQFGKPARDFGFADPGRPDHQDILRQHFLAQGFGQLLAPPAVPQRDGDCTLGVVLADNIAVEFGNNFSRREKSTHRQPLLKPSL
jgi:hypothetical protein